MKDKKIYYGIVIFLIIYLIVVLILFNKKEDTLKNYMGIAINNDTFFLYKNNTWRSVNKKYRINYNWYKFDVYEGNNFLNNYYMIYSGVWNMFTENKVKINRSFNDLIGITTDMKYKIKDFVPKNNYSSDKIINKVFEKYNIPSNIQFTNNSLITIDIDNDSKLESIYTVTNVFSDIVQPVTFGFIFLVDDNSIYMIYDKVFDNNTLTDTCKPYINNLLDFNDNNYILVTCSYYSDLGKKILLYQYKNKKIKEIISN